MQLKCCFGGLVASIRRRGQVDERHKGADQSGGNAAAPWDSTARPVAVLTPCLASTSVRRSSAGSSSHDAAATDLLSHAHQSCGSRGSFTAAGLRLPPATSTPSPRYLPCCGSGSGSGTGEPVSPTSRSSQHCNSPSSPTRTGLRFYSSSSQGGGTAALRQGAPPQQCAAQGQHPAHLSDQARQVNATLAWHLNPLAYDAVTVAACHSEHTQGAAGPRAGRVDDASDGCSGTGSREQLADPAPAAAAACNGSQRGVPVLAGNGMGHIINETDGSSGNHEDHGREESSRGTLMRDQQDIIGAEDTGRGPGLGSSAHGLPHGPQGHAAGASHSPADQPPPDEPAEGPCKAPRAQRAPSARRQSFSSAAWPRPGQGHSLSAARAMFKAHGRPFKASIAYRQPMDAAADGPAATAVQTSSPSMPCLAPRNGGDGSVQAAGYHVSNWTEANAVDVAGSNDPPRRSVSAL